jgi:FkbM family methyltransferase
MSLRALFYPDVPFDSLFIPFIYKEIYIEGIYIDTFNQKKDMTVVDIGANIGVVTQYMRDYAKVVYSVEPSKEHYEALVKNVEYNKWDNVKTFNMAIADKNGEMILNNNTSNRTCHSLVLGYGQGSEKVKTQSMDTFFEENKIEKCDFMKFDTEGAEDMIIFSEGFKKVIPKIDAIMIEFHYPSFPKIVNYLIEQGYKARRYQSSATIVLFNKS